ncbi:hypothetical protein M9H77_32208 [Catharanthus roseus]|uniref:Uncharacterized protein n=1 Tax=Catharanthus roseus TaxID=4058 RepID=A0ACC0A657_CATRO|nr:hypothetical protein M9H77_32208 [Catharanthus roseus]
MANQPTAIVVAIAKDDRERKMNPNETSRIHKSMRGKGSDNGKKPMASAVVEKTPPTKKPVFGKGKDEDRIKLSIWLALSLSGDCFENEKKKSTLRKTDTPIVSSEVWEYTIGFHNDILNPPQARANLWPTTPARPLGT